MSDLEAEFVMCAREGTKRALNRMKLLLNVNGVDPNQARDEHNRTALYNAASAGNVHVCKWLLMDAGAGEDLEGGTYSPLHVAAANNQLKVVELLLGQGVDVDLVDAEGQTALHKAVIAGASSVYEFLVELSGDVKDNSGVTARELRAAQEISQQREQVEAERLRKAESDAVKLLPSLNERILALESRQLPLLIGGILIGVSLSLLYTKLNQRID